MSCADIKSDQIQAAVEDAITRLDEAHYRIPDDPLFGAEDSCSRCQQCWPCEAAMVANDLRSAIGSNVA